jgi:hypothetical protein
MQSAAMKAKAQVAKIFPDGLETARRAGLESKSNAAKVKLSVRQKSTSLTIL